MAAAATRTRQDAASFRFNSRLAARFHQRQAALVAAAERLAGRVRRLYDRLAAELAQTAAEAGLAGLPRLEGRVDVELEEIRRAIQAELTLAGRRASREAADAILAALPPEWLPILLGLATAKTSTPESVEPIMEADPWSIEDELAAIRGWQTGGSALDRDAAMNLIRSLLFPPPSAQDVNGWLTQAVPGGLSWDDRLRHWEQPARAAMLSELTIGLAAGENVDQLRGRIKPFADGVAWKAQRIARTEANRVAERASRATIDGMGGLVDGLQIVAVMDQWTRPEHAARNGRVYRRGQDGVYRDDRGNPLPDLPDAPNCRCMTIPVLTMPEAFKEDPALRAAFETATGKLIPDPASYADWWERAGQRERMTAVGVRRYQAVRDRLGRAPQWADFIDTDGTLLPVDHLQQESPQQWEQRRKEVLALLDARRQAFQAVASRGYLNQSANGQSPTEKSGILHQQALDALEMGDPQQVTSLIGDRKLVGGLGQELVGHALGDRELAKLAGGLNRADVLVSLEGDGLRLETRREGFRALRWLGPDSGGVLKLELIRMDVPEPLRRQGLATRSLARTLQQASRLGVEYAEATASRSAGEAGYYALARVGFDAKLPADWLEMYGKDLAALGLAPQRLADLMATAEGRTFWRVHGRTIDVRMELRPGSDDILRFAQYLQQRRQEGRTMAESQAGSQRPQPPEYPIYGHGLTITEEDEAILDGIWAKFPPTEEERRRKEEFERRISPGTRGSLPEAAKQRLEAIRQQIDAEKKGLPPQR